MSRNSYNGTINVGFSSIGGNWLSVSSWYLAVDCLFNPCDWVKWLLDYLIVFNLDTVSSYE